MSLQAVRATYHARFRDGDCLKLYTRMYIYMYACCLCIFCACLFLLVLFSVCFVVHVLCWTRLTHTHTDTGHRPPLLRVICLVGEGGERVLFLSAFAVSNTAFVLV